MKKLLLSFPLFTLFVSLILFLSVRGLPGNPTPADLNTANWKENGPFELSPERGRFALLYSFIEDKSLSFSLPLARFVVPDLGYQNGRYVSLFAPGVSFLLIPGYLLGRFYGSSQFGAGLVVALFALCNVLLIRAIAKKLGAGNNSAAIAGFIFLFGTPAFAYAANIYQHHISTFLILASLYLLLAKNRLRNLFFIWLFCAASISVDYPNFIMMMPIGVAALLRFFDLQTTPAKITLNIKLVSILTLFGAALPLVFFLWYNQAAYGHPFQLSGTVPSVRAIDDRGLPAAPSGFGLETTNLLIHPENQQKSTLAYFDTRNMLNGFYIHFLSPDRGLVFFSPVILLGFMGLYLLYRRNHQITPLLTAILGANILMYSMWGDPWGGWAFGSRYLIPGYAILSLGIAVTFTRFKSHWLFITVFVLLAAYSLAVNTLGAVTTSANPPRVEVLSLESQSHRQEKYTYARNWDYLNAGGIKSYLYHTLGYRYTTPLQYYFILSGSLIFAIILLALLSRRYDTSTIA